MIHTQNQQATVLAPSSTRISSSLPSHGHNDRDTYPPNTTVTCTRVMDQDYPTTVPSPGVNATIYPSSLPLESGKMIPNIFRRSMDSFLVHEGQLPGHSIVGIQKADKFTYKDWLLIEFNIFFCWFWVTVKFHELSLISFHLNSFHGHLVKSFWISFH